MNIQNPLYGNKKHKLMGESGGSTTVVMVAMMPVFLLLMGLTIDTGRVMAAKAELYKGGDIAAEELAANIDMTVAAETGEVVAHMTDADAREIVVKNTNGLCGGTLLDVRILNSQGFVEVESEAEVPMLFSGIIGKRATRIKTTSLGRLKPLVASLNQ